MEHWRSCQRCHFRRDHRRNVRRKDLGSCLRGNFSVNKGATPVRGCFAFAERLDTLAQAPSARSTAAAYGREAARTNKKSGFERPSSAARLVPQAGLEPARLAATDFESAASISNMLILHNILPSFKVLCKCCVSELSFPGSVSFVSIARLKHLFCGPNKLPFSRTPG
jgi:hypothetical protein